MKKIGRIFGVALLCSILFSCSNLLERLEHAAIPLHTVSYESEWGTAPTSVGVLDNTALTQEHLPLLLAVGYTFEGWYCEDTKIEVGYILHDSITLTAKWKANSYSVLFNKNAEQATGTMTEQKFVYDESQNLIVNSFENPGYSFAGWNTNADGSGSLYADEENVKNLTAENEGCTVLFAQWKLEEDYTITYNLNGGINNAHNPTSYNVESETILLQSPTKTGYIFVSWVDQQGNVVTEIRKGTTGDITLTAQWSTNTDTPYKVEHYQQNTTDDGYTLFETEEKNGSTDSETLATPKEYTGFIAQSIEQGTILPDGSTVVKVYYDRKVFTLTFDTDGGSEVKSITEKYGTTITAPENPTKEGYSFMGWNQEIPKTMPAENVTYKAQWQENTLGIKVQAPSYSDIPNLATPTISGTTVTFVAPEEYASYSWYIDGVLQDNEHTQSFILDTTNLSARSYYIMLVVIDEKDAVYSAQYELEVTK